VRGFPPEFEIRQQHQEMMLKIEPDPELIHAEFFRVGYNFETDFKSISEFRYNKQSGDIQTRISAKDDGTGYLCHPLISDAMIQTAVYTILKFVGLEKLALPVKFKQFTWLGFGHDDADGKNDKFY
jgi:hypothetical protein